MTLGREQMERAIRAYFDGCNKADHAKIMSFFTPDAVHYFPGGSPFGAARGARAIADLWLHCVEVLGSWWTIDRMAIDEATREAVIEWTHFKPKRGQVLRGDEWYKFDDRGLITEIRAYYACPPMTVWRNMKSAGSITRVRVIRSICPRRRSGPGARARRRRKISPRPRPGR